MTDWQRYHRSAPFLLATVLCLNSPSIRAQEKVVFEAAAQPAATTPAEPGKQVPTAGKPGQPMPPPGVPGGPVKPGGPPMPGQKPDGKPEEGKPEEKSKVTARPMKPATPPKREEFQVRPDGNGKLRFNFRGQPWPDVLEWLASVSGMSLDWQEVPADYLNLSTQREYTVLEARDLINRHLLARGFTLLQSGEVLTVANIAKLDPGLVPRVEAAELATRQSHEYVKVSFKLDWLLAENAVEEVKPMMSPNGKLTALKSTNRLEAIDAVNNLQQIWALLSMEQSEDGQKRLVREFQLKNTRASEVHVQLITLLGIEAKKPAGPMTPEQQQQMQQQAMMAQQMAQQRGGQPAPPAAKKKEDEEVHLIVNSRKNSILANAPSDRMAVIEQAVEKLDVASDRDQSPLAAVGRMKVYRLAGLDPEPLVKTIQESGNLDPNTRMEIDKQNKAIIAYATLADHVLIRTLVEKLDTSGRRFEVIPIRRLDAAYVAGTVEFMMAGSDKDKQQTNRNPYDYFSYYGSRRNPEPETNQDKFRVDADVEFNRLLLWTNDIELTEVENLLVKLGEIPPRGGNRERTRLIESMPVEDAAELIERIRRAWPNVAPNPLQLPNVEKPRLKSDKVDPADESPPTEKSKRMKSSVPVSATELDTAEMIALADEAIVTEDPLPPDTLPASPARADSRSDTLRPADNNSEDADLIPENAVPGNADSRELAPRRQGFFGDHSSGAPIRIAVGPDGRLLLSSDDTQALDLLEEMIRQLAPPKSEFKVFQLKHAPAYWVKLNLEEFFEDKEPKKQGSGYPRYMFYDLPQQQTKDRNRLSSRRPLKFISDTDTNTILAQGADPGQLRTIQELIDLYDVPEPADSQSARVSGVFTVKYSKAKAIADTVKDVYRDLLSTNDRALANANAEQNQKPGRSETYITNFGGSDDDSKKKEKTQVTFKGKLSIGIDELSNTLLVSTEGEHLYRNVSRMIKELDEAAKPLSTVQVVQLGGNLNAEKVSKALSQMFKKQTPPQQQPGQNPQQPGGRQVGQPQGDNAAFQVE